MAMEGWINYGTETIICEHCPAGFLDFTTGCILSSKKSEEVKREVSSLSLASKEARMH
jgi:hypothetical protein